MNSFFVLSSNAFLWDSMIEIKLIEVVLLGIISAFYLRAKTVRTLSRRSSNL